MQGSSETQMIRGRELAAAIRAEVSTGVIALKAQGVTPRLAAVLVGQDAAISSYIEVKRRLAEKLSIIFDVIALPVTTAQSELETKLRQLSQDPAVNGIVLELPLPVNLDMDLAIRAIDPLKDVDGMTPANVGLVLRGNEKSALLSATAQACVTLAEVFGPLAGKRVAMVGKGRTVGKPLIPMLLNRHATLTVCHSETSDLKAALADCEIIFVAVGKPGLLNAGNVHPGQIVIDAGTTMQDGQLVGDTAAEVNGLVRALTPVPDGVGPLTTAFIFKNLLKAISLQQHS
jgi:methylenetetrahydrofolate dehydrogenase (NADP+)/methenyltetrahydrofolate cyclohydrolase